MFATLALVVLVGLFACQELVCRALHHAYSKGYQDGADRLAEKIVSRREKTLVALPDVAHPAH